MVNGAGGGQNGNFFVLFCTVVIQLIYFSNVTNGQQNLQRNLQLGGGNGGDGGMTVTWTVNFTERSINFLVTAETKGFVGFGFGPQGSMNGADCIIGGVYDDGTVYFSDRFAIGNREPIIDKHQDWFLLSASENETHTVLNFTRLLDTCDPEDLAITDATTKLIWAMGPTDDITYHQERKGATAVTLLDPPPPIVDTSKFDVWNITVNTVIPTRNTIYWCTVHKSPKYYTKRQIVGFRALLKNDGARAHDHHLVLRKCGAKRGSKVGNYLDSYLGKPGGECEDPDVPGVHHLMQYCEQYYFSWAKGGDSLFFPDNVGISLDSDQEYFLLEMHYDNPNNVAGVSCETQVQVFTTDKIREMEAGLLTISYVPGMSLVIPPEADKFVVAGHCSSRCTSEKLPKKGLNIFNAQLHSHLSGRQLNLRHFRPTKNGQFEELPGVYDANYDFSFQQNRPLREFMKILPGDHLTFECTYSTTWRQPPSVTVGGLSTRNEMCAAFLTYYPKTSSLDLCASVYPMERLQARFGVEQFDLASDVRDPLILKPDSMAHTNWTTLLNTMVDWTPELRHELETMMRDGDHLEQCIDYPDDDKNVVANSNKIFDEPLYTTGYPKKFKAFVPPGRPCKP